MSLLRRFTAAGTLSGLLLSGSAGCDFAGDSKEQKSSWQEPGAYTYTLESTEGHRALLGKYRIAVRDRHVAEAEGFDEYSRRVVTKMPQIVPTLGDLLREVEQVRNRNADTAEVTYAADGHPTQIVWDLDKDAVDDEAKYVITAYEQVDQ